MLRVFGELLLVFWVLGLIVHLDGPIHLFVAAGLALLAIDWVMTRHGSRHGVMRARRSVR